MNNIRYNDLLHMESVNFSCDRNTYIHLTNHHEYIFT